MLSPLRPRFDLDDERVLIGVTAGVLWLVGGVVAAICQMLPNRPDVDPTAFLVLDLAVIAYGIASLTVIPWERVSRNGHALATLLLTPIVGLAIWLTGGAESYLQPVLILPLLHIAYFFPWRQAVPLVAELVLVAGSPVLYDESAVAGPSRLVAFAVVAGVVLVVLRSLKGGLVASRERERRMALADPLTGLVNRRGFDAALNSEVASRGDVELGRRVADEEPGFALVLFDLDGFKHVNDTLGHPAGDQLLRSVSAHASAVVRPGDTLARIGGDEFAVVAPGAGEEGARRLCAALEGAALEAGHPATVAYAVHPHDGVEGDELLRVADRRLYAGKADRVG